MRSIFQKAEVLLEITGLPSSASRLSMTSRPRKFVQLMKTASPSGTFPARASSAAALPPSSSDASCHFGIAIVHGPGAAHARSAPR